VNMVIKLHVSNLARWGTINFLSRNVPHGFGWLVGSLFTYFLLNYLEGMLFTYLFT
jgi:hypothetical protein